MYSLMRTYKVTTPNDFVVEVTLTARRMDNDINGNPRYKVHIWSNASGSIWSPTIKGFKRCKDDGYVLRGYDTLPDLMSDFKFALEVTLNES